MHLTAYFYASKNRKIMKLMALLLFVACFHASARTDAQTVTLHQKNASLDQVFAEISRQTGYLFFYSENVVEKANRVTIHVEGKSIEEVLELCFRNQPLQYTVIEKTIVVKEKSKNSNSAGVIPGPYPESLPPPINIKGRIVNENGEPVIASIQVKGTTMGTTTNDNGEFELKGIDDKATLIISGVSIESFEVKVNGRTELALNAKIRTAIEEAVTVEVNTGYQRIPKERTTGSFGLVNNEQLNRKIGLDIINRLEGTTPGIFFDRRRLAPGQAVVPVENVMIRGISTLTDRMKTPLIILNNFPYDGDINNINPNDVESISILRDAGAASIWGARAANGVIVITTKQGGYNQKTQISFNNNTELIQSPDLFSIPQMSTADFIENERFLFENGFYDAELADPMAQALTPVVEILDKKRSGLLGESEANKLIAQYAANDVRNDFKNYVYRKGVNQQYYLGLSGGNQNIKFAAAGGLDKNRFNLVGSNFRRVTLRSDLTALLAGNVTFNLGILFTNSQSKDNSLGEIGSNNYTYRPSGNALYPYAQFADASGNPLVIAKDHRSGYIDTAGNGKLLDWKFRPLEELNNQDNKTNLQDILINLGTNYKINDFLSLQLNYQYQRSNSETNRFYNTNTYFTRNIINQYAQIDASNNVIYKVPVGGIKDMVNTITSSNNGRVQFNIDKRLNQKSQVVSIIGGEIRERIRTNTANRLYGYSEQNLSFGQVDYLTRYPVYGSFDLLQVPQFSGIGRQNDRFVSVFANAAYTYLSKYTLSLSGRRDAANVFGVNINNKWRPFWTAGASWIVSNEPFLKTETVNYLKLRTTYGYQGNVNNSIPTFTVLSHHSGNAASLNQPFANISIPGNPDLSWETVKQFNLGIDFAFLNKRLSGSVDGYHKWSDNLILRSAVDPTSGIQSVSKNSAGMTGKGIDLALNSININHSAFKWNTEFGFSYVRNKVTDFNAVSILSNGTLLSGGSAYGLDIKPIKGTSPYAIYSYPYAGLDPQTGDPQGYLGKNVSNNYFAIYNQRSDTANLIYHGSSVPTSFGFLNNIIKFRSVSVVININYRLGYYFRKSTINYYSLNWAGITHPDFAKRWQNPGDEKSTNIPSRVYPVNESLRDDFFAYSPVNVLKGDHIRLQFVRLGYDFTWNNGKVFRAIQLYATMNNIGIIWRANKEKLDPDYQAGQALYLPPRSFAAGVKVDL